MSDGPEDPRELEDGFDGLHEYKPRKAPEDLHCQVCGKWPSNSGLPPRDWPYPLPEGTRFEQVNLRKQNGYQPFSGWSTPDGKPPRSGW